ncbi:MAG: glycosyltransferase [Gammaproteobacteria bacterium]
MIRQKLPFFSIIVPTYARARQLADCLRSIARLDYPRDGFELVVVDDGSKTPPEDTIAPFVDRINVTLHSQPHAGPATARNTGAARAKGDFLAFIDDDCAPARNWLRALAARFAVAADCAIGGQTLNALVNNCYSTASQLLVDYLYAYYNANPDRARFFTSNNLVLPADRFHRIGGFDNTFPLAAAEDRELCDRWLRHGYNMTYAPEVLVYHSHTSSLREFWLQHFNYGRGAFSFHQVRSQRDGERITLEPLSFYSNLLRYPFTRRHRNPLMLATLLVMSQGANTAGFFWEKMIKA